MPDADLDLAVPAVFFGAVGTAGQRCTSTRRLYLHRAIAPTFIERLTSLYSIVRPGDPLDQSTLLGPLHTRAAVGIYTDAVDRLRKQGAEILTGGASYSGLNQPLDGGNFVMPTIAVPKAVNVKDAVWSQETFAPVLSVGVFDELEEAIAWNNGVPQVCLRERIYHRTSLTAHVIGIEQQPLDEGLAQRRKVDRTCRI